MSDPLDLFTPPVRAWFRDTCGRPTPPQAQGWPVIRRGEHTLILAPTGSGKTLAAFLCEIDRLFQELSSGEKGPAGIRLVYVSPLKALNNDVERNLRQPLEGIRAAAARLGLDLPPLRVAVRTGDTPARDRAAMLKRPPHILITTPESLYLMLTSPKARDLFRATRAVIVDEIHTLCGNKRGVHLSLSLERLCRLAESPVQRIGLSATQKPLDEVARYLGGQEFQATGGTEFTERGRAENNDPSICPSSVNSVPSVADSHRLVPRPVTIVEAGYKKPMELQVVTVVDDFDELPGDTIWPAVVPNVLNDIRRHRSTLVFCNNRRLAERTADRLNAQLEAEQSEEIPPGSTEALAPGGVARDRGMFAIGASGPIKAHHGSTSKESRLQMEEDLKAGRLPALIGTSSLELGIDIGAVDLVVQLQSPKSVSQGLQRVGRSGHLVGQTSRGRIYATFREDLLEAAAVARGMLEGDVEPTYTPLHPLDVLAQQVVAMVSVEPWPVEALYDLARQAYAYRALSWEVFCGVLDMLAGKYHPDKPLDSPQDAQDGLPAPIKSALSSVALGLRARISWDRVNNRLSALPGSRLLAITNGGTIPDTGAYSVYLSDGKTKLGELDEEFVFESRPGDTFLLGSQVWRVLDIDEQRIVVGDAAGATPRMPFWKGDYPWRPYDLGRRIARFRAALAEHVAADAHAAAGASAAEAWLRRDYALDEKSARGLAAYARQQLDALGVIASDTTVVVESFQDALGEPHVVIHSSFGGRINGAWALAIASALRDRVGVEPEVMTNDDGILLHFPRASRTGVDMMPVADLVRRMPPAEARERILRGLPDSAVFGAHFRMNAARSLLLPRARGGKRTPFWLQRLKARDLLALVRQYDDFPIVAETYRDCLRDVFDLPHLEELLERVVSGEVAVVAVDTLAPSPVANGLLYNFASKFMYEGDAPKAERQLRDLAVRRDLLEDVLAGVKLSDVLKPQAIALTREEAQRAASGYQARSAEELALTLEELGDLTGAEIAVRSAGDSRAWIDALRDQGRIVSLDIPSGAGLPARWVPAELAAEYQAAFQPGGEASAPGEAILRRYLAHASPVTRRAILDRYAFREGWLDEALDRLVAAREAARGRITAGVEEEEYCDRRRLERIHRRTLTILRKEVQPVGLPAYADFLCRWQRLHPEQRLSGADGLRQIMRQLRGLSLPGLVWEQDALPGRLRDYRPAWLDALCDGGETAWVGGGREARRGRIRYFPRGEGGLFLDEAAEADLSPGARAAWDFLKSEGASFTADLQAGLGIGMTACREALAELVLAGLATNDALGALRGILAGEGIEPAAPRAASRSALEQDLAARRARAEAPFQRPPPARMREARRRVVGRLGAAPQPVPWTGRWSLVRRPGLLGPPLSDDARAARLAGVFLERYGVLMRECFEREDAAGRWPLAVAQLQRMEMRGEVRRGYFVAGLSGLQFALPEAVERLRACAESSDESLAVVNACDPANVYGGDLPDGPLTARGEPMRFARLASTHTVLWRGRPVLLAEDGGQRLATLQGAEPSLIQRALQAWLSRPNAASRVVVGEWNDGPAVESEGRALLQAQGFYRGATGMEWWSQV